MESPTPALTLIEPTLEIHLSTNVACIGSLAVLLSPMQTELASILYAQSVVPETIINEGLYGASDPPSYGINSICFDLHRRLAPLGWGVCCFKSRGRALYKLEDGLPLGATAKYPIDNSLRNKNIIIHYKNGYTQSRIAYAMKLPLGVVKGVIRRHKDKA